MINDLTLQLTAKATGDDFEMLAINAGVAKGHDLDFSAAVLKESISLWDNVPCMLDHPGFLDFPSVRDLAGSLHHPTWNKANQGIQAKLTPAGPAAEVLIRLREAAKENPAIMSAVGFSAVLRVKYKSDGKVETINSPVFVAGSEKRKPALAPEIGAHTREVLRELGYSPDAIETLIRSGAATAGK